ncbi:hypothetical protein AMS68_003643 [Peltaster fructicola]|uniref:Pentacotripeptide-repeat region of PRORP domain-containing protein n=1 Tax=Peltaster fructicola TaxID=286661 RepID=A0A6H0XTX5_9PEZI|nr:hypothetical protein AMS68_003643 [Peltaster fructicola]
MSKLGTSLKPQIISAISKITSTTRPECKTTALPRSSYHTLNLRTQPPQNGGELKTLEDRFLGLLLQAGSCQKHRTSVHKSQGRAQCRTLVMSSQRRSGAVAAKVEHDDDEIQQSRAIHEPGLQHGEIVRHPHRIRNQSRHSLKRSRRVYDAAQPKHSAPEELAKVGEEGASQTVIGTVSMEEGAAIQTYKPVGSHRHNRVPTERRSRHTPERRYRGVDSYGLQMNDHLADLPVIPRSKYQEMVDIYGLPIEEEPESKSHTPSLADWGMGLGSSMDSIIQYPLAPRLTISAQEEDRARRREKQLREALTPQHIQMLDQLHRLLGQPPGTINQNRIWQLYSGLPSPQVYYLSHKDVDRLFQHLAWVEYKSFQGAKEKVFQLLEQCNKEGIALHRHHWTTAITLAGRWVRNIETDQVREAIETWMSMEQHGIRADPVVFNVLFDVAAKAGRFALADTIHSEMKARDMPINRYFRCSMIHCAGMRKDGDAVRAAFNEFVAGGDIVDTAVMNLVLRSLIRSGEGEAAEHVFSNMKSLHAEKFPGANARSWQERRAFTKSLTKTVAALQKKQKKHEASFFGSYYSNKDQLEELQRLTPIHPDESTYRIIIGYHALVSGDLGRIQELLSEMRAEGFHIHGSVYVNIFWGFVRHGGFTFSAWTPDLLEHFWREFTAAVPYEDVLENRSAVVQDDTSLTMTDVDHELSVMSEDHRPVHFSVIVAKNIMHAFYRCCGKARMIKAWKDIQASWVSMTPEEEAILHAYCRKRLREHIWQDSNE